jgi:hypothetical protein
MKLLFLFSTLPPRKVIEIVFRQSVGFPNWPISQMFKCVHYVHLFRSRCPWSRRSPIPVIPRGKSWWRTLRSGYKRYRPAAGTSGGRFCISRFRRRDGFPWRRRLRSGSRRPCSRPNKIWSSIWSQRRRVLFRKIGQAVKFHLEKEAVEDLRWIWRQLRKVIKSSSNTDICKFGTCS